MTVRPRFRPFLLLAAVIGVIVLVSNLSRAQVRQPFPFNHLRHKKEKVGCFTCHSLYETQAAAGRPTIDICMTCHDEEKKNPKILQVKEKGLRHEEYDWKRIYRVPTHIYFSHRRHVLLGKIECKVCHGDVGERATPQARPAVDIWMNTCIDCHRKKGASTDCNACHH